MSSQVNFSSVGMTAGINLPNSVIVQGGVDGAFFPANQIGWGKSTFAGVEFASTEGLLNAIETAIGTGGTGAVTELKNYLISEKYVTEERWAELFAAAIETYATKQFVSDANTALSNDLKAWVAEQKFAAASDVEAQGKTIDEHIADTDIHITADERTSWNAAKASIDAFLSDNDLTEGVVDTLKEIQDYITSDGSAADKMTQDIAANAKAIADETSRATEAEAKALSDAKAYADGLAVNYDKAGDAAQALTDAKAYTDGKVAEINEVIAENEEVAAEALNDLNTRVTENTTKIETLTADYAAGDATTLASAKAYADGLATNYDGKGSAAAAEQNAKDYADGLAGNYDAAGAAATAEQNAKDYADGLAGNYDAAGAAATAEQNAKDYADGLAGNYDAAGAAATAEQNAKDYADGLAGNYDAAGAAATAEQNAKDYADGLAGNYDAAGAAAAAESAAKSHADSKAATAEKNAKDYADAQIAAIPAVDLTPYAYVSTVNDAVKALEDKDAEIVTSYTAADAALAARIKTIEDAPYATESYVTSTVASKVAEVVANAPEDFNTLKEIADWIANDVTSAAELANKVTANENAIKAISDDYLKAADKTEIVNAYTAADAALGKRIDDVVTSYTAADAALGKRIDDVVTSYTAADAALGTRIDNVEAAYVTADAALGTRIDNVEAAYVTADNDVKTWVSDNYTTSVNPSANSVTINGEQIKFSFTDNVLSVSKYIETSISSVSLSTVNSSKTQTGGSFYVGTSYTITAGIDMAADTQTLTVKVNNPTTNNYKLAIHNGTSYILEDADFRTTNGNITQTIAAVADVANVDYTGTASWGSYTHKVSTSGHATLTAYVTEEGKQTISKSVTQSSVSASAVAKGKAPVMKGTDATAAGCTSLVKDLVYGEVSGTIELPIQTFAAGQVPTIAVPTCAGKTLQGWNAEGSFQDTSWAVIETKTVELHDCSTEYAVYCVVENPNAEVLVPKANAGEGKVLIKLV